MGEFAFIDYVILVAYLLFILYIGIAVGKKEMKGKEFFKGDGTIPWWVTSVSLFATLLSPISFLSLAGNSYSGTWILWFAQLGLIIAVPMAIIFFLPVYRNLNLDTAYHYLEIRFDKRLRVISSALFIIYQIGRMSIIMYLPAIALAAVTGIRPLYIILFMGVIATIYSSFGGIKSVLWTDFIQGVVLIGGGVFALIVLIFAIDGGVGEIFNTGIANNKFFSEAIVFDPTFTRDSILLLIIGAGLSTGFSYISSQDMVQRYLTTNDIKQMNKMTIGNGVLSLSTATLFFFLGTALFVFYTQRMGANIPGGNSDLIFANFIVSELPVGISGLLIAALFAAGQSTLSTGLNSVATSWTLDIQQSIMPGLDDKRSTKIARFVSAIVGVFSILVAIILANSDISSAYEWFNGLMGLVLGIVGGTFALGVLTKKVNADGALVAFIATSIVAVYVSYFTDISLWAYSIINLISSFVFGYIFSVIMNKKSAAKKSKHPLTYYDLEK
ncbi:sodium:solute symporter [Salinicoccus roseus]|uniref:sodium:solute symporter n=1 Tax=Salinicoccus roseus TaxID=45670 RepID=UPI0023015C9F|nr:sodium:solute symporter [Salinicoccus roseus]